jgi:hypothetical protein
VLTLGGSKLDRSASIALIPVLLGSLMILVGVFLGSGSGARGLLELLAVATGLLLNVLSIARSSSEHVSWIASTQEVSETESEFPVWKPSTTDVRSSVSEREPATRKRLTRAVLIVGLLILPQQVWKRIRWDIQKVNFPNVSSELPLSINRVDTDDEPAQRSAGEDSR